MKQRALLFTLVLGALLTACDKNDKRDKNTTLITFEGAAWTPYVAATAGETYSAAIGTPDYAWKESKTTLTSPMLMSSYGDTEFFSGGFIVSSYNSADEKSYGSYPYDLYLYNPGSSDTLHGGGRNGSDNFLVGFGNLDLNGDNRPALTFSDGKPRTVKSCFINTTCYFYNTARNGNDFTAPLSDDDEVTIIATGYGDDNRETATTTITLARKDDFITSWTLWDLSTLGEVVSIRFAMTGPENEWGLTIPTYFAIDDIKVEWQ